MKVVLVAIALTVGGCSLTPGGGQIQQAIVTAVDAGTEDRKAYNDTKARTIIAATCDISLGAFYRLGNTAWQEALAMLCSGMRPGEAMPELPTTEVVVEENLP